MKISIVTVSFNQRQFLESAIKSVLSQNYPELEYIVVDPGSTDGSRHVIARYSGRISKMVLEPDAGAADGLNKGFSYATGSVYGFLNSDDMLLPGALHAVAACFDESPAADIVMGDGYITDEDGNRLRHIKAASFTPMRLVYGGTTSLQQSTFFRSSAYLASNRFNVSNTSCWDVELFLDLVQKGATVKYLRQDLALFRVHGASITGTNRLRHAYKRDRQRLFCKVRGRDWRTIDHLTSAYYKCLRFAADPLQLFSTVRSRLGDYGGLVPRHLATYLRNVSRDIEP